MEKRRGWPAWVAPIVLVGASALLMVATLASPDRITFDEVYYVNDARDILEFGVESGFVVHPPVGKLLIAASIWLFGDTPFGWRALGGLAGVATVLLTYLIGRRLFDRVGPAALAALLVAIDGVFLVQARTAMLDVFLALFVVLGAWALVVHVQRVREADQAWLAADPGPHDHLPRRDATMLLVAGVAFGLAVATKWSGLLGVGAAGMVMIGAELTRRYRVMGSPWRRLGRGTGLITASLVAIPLGVYLLTWTPWLVSFTNTYEATKVCDDAGSVACQSTPLPSKAAALWDFHGRIVRFHAGLEADHSYRAPAYTWPVLARPVVYYYETCRPDRANRVAETDTDGNVTIPGPCLVEEGQAAEMLGVGNPGLWWTFLPALALLVAGAVRRDRRVLVPMAFVAAQYLPWLIVSRPVFSFYAVPVVPFMALGIGAAIARMGDREPVWRPLAGAVTGAVVWGGLLALTTLVSGTSPTRPTYGLVMAVGGVLGAAVASDPRHLLDRSPPPVAAPGWGPAAQWTTIVVAVVAVGLAIFFLPVWLGVPLPEDAVRSRWWFQGWI